MFHVSVSDPPSSAPRFATVGPSPGRGRRRAVVQALRALSWLVPVACAGFALQGRWSGLLFGSAAVATGASAWWYRRFLGDYARSLAVATHGSLEVTVNQLVVRHTGVLSGSVAIPWASVRAVCVDHGSRPAHAGPGASGQPGSRFPLRPADDEAGKDDDNGDDEEGGSSGQGPTALFTCEKLGRKQTGTRIPLLSAAPVVPNVLVLVDPAVELAWHYPFVASPFNPPRGDRWPARPWPDPSATPAFFAALADPAALAAALAAHVPVRDPEPADKAYLAAHGLSD